MQCPCNVLYCTVLFHPIGKCHVMLIWWFICQCPCMLCSRCVPGVLSACFLIPSVGRSVGRSAVRSFIVRRSPPQNHERCGDFSQCVVCLQRARSLSRSLCLAGIHASASSLGRRSCGSIKETNTIGQTLSFSDLVLQYYQNG